MLAHLLGHVLRDVDVGPAQLVRRVPQNLLAVPPRHEVHHHRLEAANLMVTISDCLIIISIMYLMFILPLVR